MRFLFLLMFPLLCLLMASHSQANDQQNEQELKRIQAEIQALQTWLKQAESEYQGLQKDLKQSDEEVAKLAKKVNNTRDQLAEEQSKLKKLRKEQVQQNLLQQQHQRHLSNQVQTARKLGDEAAVRFWLTQDDPAKNQRLLQYFGYFNRARIDQIHITIDELDRLSRIEELIVEQETQLKATERRLANEKQSLDRQRQQQQQLLTKLNQQMTNESERLKSRQADRQRLEELLNEVANLISNSQLKNEETPFRNMRGKLSRPLAGRVLNAYGSRNPENKQLWRGWQIRAVEGSAVTAIHHGRVVFSDWLRGFGLVLIIDHGNDYLSLYAHNQSLLKDVGSWVISGDKIATAGSSGGLAKPTLYFEVRHKGKPQDPAVWLSRK